VDAEGWKRSAGFIKLIMTDGKQATTELYGKGNIDGWAMF